MERVVRRTLFACTYAMLLYFGCYMAWKSFLKPMPVLGTPYQGCKELPAEHFAQPYAYVTYLATKDYLPGVSSLLYSLVKSNTSHPLVIMVVSTEMETIAREHADSLIAECGYHQSRIIITRVDFIKGPNSGLKLKRFAHNWTKMRIFQLPYKKVIFLDADIVVIHNIDHLFTLPGPLSGVVRNRNDDFNSGMMVAAPCEALFRDMEEKLNAWDFAPKNTQVRR